MAVDRGFEIQAKLAREMLGAELKEIVPLNSADVMGLVGDLNLCRETMVKKSPSVIGRELLEARAYVLEKVLIMLGQEEIVNQIRLNFGFDPLGIEQNAGSELGA